MTFIGWWMATGTIAQAITERKTKIEAAESSIPKGDIPNDNWTKRLSEVNDKQDTSIACTNQSRKSTAVHRRIVPKRRSTRSTSSNYVAVVTKVRQLPPAEIVPVSLIREWGWVEWVWEVLHEVFQEAIWPVDLVRHRACQLSLQSSTRRKSLEMTVADQARVSAEVDMAAVAVAVP